MHRVSVFALAAFLDAQVWRIARGWRGAYTVVDMFECFPGATANPFSDKAIFSSFVRVASDCRLSCGTRNLRCTALSTISCLVYINDFVSCKNNYGDVFHIQVRGIWEFVSVLVPDGALMYLPGHRRRPRPLALRAGPAQNQKRSSCRSAAAFSANPISNRPRAEEQQVHKWKVQHRAQALGMVWVNSSAPVAVSARVHHR